MKHEDVRRVVRDEMAKGEAFALAETKRDFDGFPLYDVVDGEVHGVVVAAWSSDLHDETCANASCMTENGRYRRTVETTQLVDCLPTEKDIRGAVREAYRKATLNLRMHLESLKDSPA